MTSCVVCGRELRKQMMGRPRSTCSARCRKALSRRRAVSPFPESMRTADRWVRAVGKRPVTPEGRPASSTNPATWSSFSSVQHGAGNGFGFMLGDGVGCYDLDNAVDEDGVKSWAREIIACIPEPVVYTELSCSGRGVHVFVEAPEERGSRRRVADGSVERYSRARFIRCGVPMKL